MAAVVLLLLCIIFAGLAAARIAEPARLAFLPLALALLAAALLVGHIPALR
jgi:hypothetical protein